MRSHGMTGAVSLIGIGLCGIAAAMLLQVTGPRAEASSRTVDAFGSGEPTVVWMGVSSVSYYGLRTIYHRLWSDGRLEKREVEYALFTSDDCLIPFGCLSDWEEVPPPPAGNGFACRADFNGDRNIDGVDLAAVLGSWGNSVACDPEPTYPCFDLGGLQLPE